MKNSGRNKIFFHYQAPLYSFQNRNSLKNFLVKFFRSEGQAMEEIRYIFCSDDYLLSLNQRHLHHNTLTDIISFDLTEPGQPLQAEIYISIDRVKENAVKFQVPFLHELHRVIFHGALHLCGFKDKKPAEIATMRMKEDYYLGQYFK